MRLAISRHTDLALEALQPLGPASRRSVLRVIVALEGPRRASRASCTRKSAPCSSQESRAAPHRRADCEPDDQRAALPAA
jgi:hypothetical protein